MRSLSANRMNRSLLRLYALVVCVMTAMSVVLIAAVPLWNSAVESASAIEQHDVYQFVTEGTIPCKACPVDPPLTLASASATTIAPYLPTPKALESEPDIDTRWIPESVFNLLRVLIGLIGMLIFGVHWQLYRNLGYAH